MRPSPTVDNLPSGGASGLDRLPNFLASPFV
jgi:hypothetical protein